MKMPLSVAKIDQSAAKNHNVYMHYFATNLELQPIDTKSTYQQGCPLSRIIYICIYIYILLRGYTHLKIFGNWIKMLTASSILDGNLYIKWWKLLHLCVNVAQNVAKQYTSGLILLDKDHVECLSPMLVIFCLVELNIFRLLSTQDIPGVGVNNWIIIYSTNKLLSQIYIQPMN